MAQLARYTMDVTQTRQFFGIKGKERTDYCTLIILVSLASQKRDFNLNGQATSMGP